MVACGISGGHCASTSRAKRITARAVARSRGSGGEGSGGGGSGEAGRWVLRERGVERGYGSARDCGERRTGERGAGKGTGLPGGASVAVGACGPSTPRGRSGAEAREGRLTCGTGRCELGRRSGCWAVAGKWRGERGERAGPREIGLGRWRARREREEWAGERLGRAEGLGWCFGFFFGFLFYFFFFSKSNSNKV